MPDLYDKIKEIFDQKYAQAQLLGEPLGDIMGRINSGDATFRDADMFAVEVGVMMADAMKEVLVLDELPGGALIRSIAQQTVGEGLKDTYGIMRNITETIQEEINSANGIGLKAASPKLETDRVDRIVEKAAAAKTQESLDATLDESVPTFARQVVDDTQKANARLHNKAGLKVTVEREYDGVGLHGGEDVCDWCLSRAGKFDYEKAMDVGAFERHEGCGCIITYTSAKGEKTVSVSKYDGWMDERNRRIEAAKEENEKKIKLYEEQRKTRMVTEQKVLGLQDNGYYGVPKTWQKSTDIISAEELLSGTNPNYNRLVDRFASIEDNDYNLNCTNCVPAYEMRCRGYHNVTAQPLSKNRGLEVEPFLAWKNAKPINAKNGVNEIIAFVNSKEEGARIQIATKYEDSIWNQRKGHTFIATKENGKCVFKDPQAGVIIKDTKKYFDRTSEVRYLRIDNLEISDKGVSACKVEK